jgi:hypothetical protein
VPSIERNLIDRGILPAVGVDGHKPVFSPRSMLADADFLTPIREAKDEEEPSKAETEDIRGDMALGVGSVHQWDRNKSQYGRVGVETMRRALSSAQPAIFCEANLKLVVTRGARARSQQRLLEYLEFIAPCIDPTTTIPLDSRSDGAFIDHVPLSFFVGVMVCGACFCVFVCVRCFVFVVKHIICSSCSSISFVC